MTSPFDANWNALTREAGLASEHIAIGATALGRANYAQVAYYFSSLSSRFLSDSREAASSHFCSIIRSIMVPFHLKVRSGSTGIGWIDC